MLKCPICLFESVENSFSILIADSFLFSGKLVRHRCPNCDVIFGTQEMLELSKEDLCAKYKQLFDSGYVGADITSTEIEVFKFLNPTKKGIYLNWGAGSKLRTSEILKQKGYTLYGFEPYEPVPASKNMIITNLDTFTMKFDGIMSNNFIEHVQSPVNTILEMKQYLKDQNCIMAHFTACWNYVYETSPFHLFFFEGRSVQIMADRTGMTVTTISPYLKLFKSK